MSFLKYHDFISEHKQALKKFVSGAEDFTRNRKLGLVHTVGHILFQALERNLNGYEITSLNYFSQFSCPEQATVRSSLSEARNKISWKAFEYLLEKLNQENESKLQHLKWRGHNVKAIDGSHLTLPASDQVLKDYPRRKNVKAHYPNGLLVTAMNVFTGQPVCASFDKDTSSERGLLGEMLEKLERGDVLLLDRGYEGYEHFYRIEQQGLFFISRVRSTGASMNQELCQFIKSKKKSAIFEIDRQLRNKFYVKLRIRFIQAGVDREGKEIILATNLMGRNRYPAKEIRKLYLCRWKVETMYYRVKEMLKVERFHSRNANGISQEIWANLVVLALVAGMRSYVKTKKVSPNFKASVEVIRRNFYLFVNTQHLKASCKASELIEIIFSQISWIRCKKQPGRKNPRISQQPVSGWKQGGQKNKLKEKYNKRSRASSTS